VRAGANEGGGVEGGAGLGARRRGGAVILDWADGGSGWMKPELCGTMRLAEKPRSDQISGCDSFVFVGF